MMTFAQTCVVVGAAISAMMTSAAATSFNDDPTLISALTEVRVSIDFEGPMFPPRKLQDELQKWSEGRLRERGVRLAVGGEIAPLFEVEISVANGCIYLVKSFVIERAMLARTLPRGMSQPVYANTWVGDRWLGKSEIDRCWGIIEELVKKAADEFADALAEAGAPAASGAGGLE